MKLFKEIFIHARKHSGFEQKELAEALNVSLVTISKFEDGEDLPSNELLPHICELLELDLEHLYFHVAYEKEKNPTMKIVLKTMHDNSYIDGKMPKKLKSDFYIKKPKEIPPENPPQHHPENLVNGDNDV